MNILVQINTFNEESEFGALSKTALEQVEQLSRFETLNVRGLLMIGKLKCNQRWDPAMIPIFECIQTQIREKEFPRVEVDILSMDMSGDY